ncbi:MAG: hypothetical protein GWN61_14945 [candidate division Zixibacteria bacterium]|nr:hypothetical protein [candidate division KSB1 bacterium]NIR65525.1 hypothetical protein [candidate division Zixibacteria bacterium]NIW46613.1 hypothetical protein [Gammaproteobacteria bacterium]NIS47210.1 hypothetical protein [candidate division Zixibacteria bacterium]NIT74897.1 hypothetical protein [candidate division KSB1 bacterium]
MKMKIFFGCFLLIFIISIYGCKDEKEPVSVSTHPEGWTDPADADFHGTAVLTESFSEQGCMSCHGEDYQGGSSGVSCFSSGCHAVFPHPDGFANRNSPNFHEKFIAENLGWDILSCQECHGSDYAGEGFQEKNCLKCHTQMNGPEACNTCHGNQENPAPPEDLAGNTSTNVKTVGAHQPHLTGTRWSTFQQGECQSCHMKPVNYRDPGHIDDSPHAEVVFNNLATFNGSINTDWDRQDGYCSNVYCHGAFEFRKDESQRPWAYTDSLITGNNPRLFWTGVGTGQAICGSCHGLPPEGHIAAQSCEGCHNSVVDENFRIINKHLHINGQIDVF